MAANNSRFVMFMIRLCILGVLLKSGLEVLVLNKDTPELIVDRVKYHLDFVQKYVYLDQDNILRFVMNYQTTIGYIYGVILLRVSAVSLFGVKMAMKFEIWFIAFCMWFFYADYQRLCIDQSKYSEFVTLLTIMSGLMMLIGYNDVPQPKVENEKVAPK